MSPPIKMKKASLSLLIRNLSLIKKEPHPKTTKKLNEALKLKRQSLRRALQLLRKRGRSQSCKEIIASKIMKQVVLMNS